MIMPIESAAQAVLRWFETDFGTSTFFFVLDFLVVVLLLPEVLSWRARRRWRSMARSLLYEALTTLEILSGELGGLNALFFPALEFFPEKEPSAPPDPAMLAELRSTCGSTRGVIELYKSRFGLTNISLQSFPTHADTLTAFVRSLIELERCLRIMETTSDWGYLWGAWKSFGHEVTGKFPTHRRAIQIALQQRYFR